MAYLTLTKDEKISHLKVWFLITAYLLFIDHGDASIGMEIFVQVLITFRYMVVFYALTIYILPVYYKTNIKKLIVLFLLTYVVHEVMNYLTFFYAMTMFGDPGTYDGVSFYEWLLTSSIFFFIASAVAFGAYQNRISRLELQKQNEKEKALLIRELGFFKNQFNFHITFNFLNYCYSYMLKSSKEAAEAIELFSEMLRYVMSTKPNEPVTLKREIEYIDQFIELHKRLNPHVCVQFNIIGEVNNKFILPCVLTTFVENAFKHGVSDDANNPIIVYLNANANTIRFEVDNKRGSQKKIHSTGVGQFNLRKQLELFYKNKHELNITSNHDNYFCQLILTS